MFGKDELKLLVSCAKSALKEEEKYIVGCVAKEHWKFKDATGICVNLNERYFQFMIWRKLMDGFPFRPETERDRADLAFYDDGTGELVGYAEIKGWWSDEGESELPEIRLDMAKLRILRPRVPGVMLILTTHPRELAKKNFDALARELGVDRTAMEIDFFDNTAEEGDLYDFAVIGFIANPGASVVPV